MKRRTPLIIALATGTAAAGALVAVAGPATAQPVTPAAAAANAAGVAAGLIASRPAVLQASADDAFVAQTPIVSHGLHYTPYQRTYKGLHVTGGDMVIATDDSGAVKATSVAQDRPINLASITPAVSSAAALKTAEGRLKAVSGVTSQPALVVYTAEGRTGTLAWEATIQGTSAEGASLQTIDVDAKTGKFLAAKEHAADAAGVGNGWIYPNAPINTTQSGSTFTLKDPAITNLSCGNFANNVVYTGPDNNWGSGVGTDRETGCADSMYSAQTEAKMLAAWDGRNAQNGTGGAWPIEVGWDAINAQYIGTAVQVGHNTSGQWLDSLDVLGHEMGHGVDDNTPGSISGNGTQEFVADTFGAATEWFANNPNDPPDFLVGEEDNVDGDNQPIRNMYNPSLVDGDNCYSSAVPTEEVHTAAGPGDHWFYLLSQGSGGNGQPASPTCNNTTVTGLGIQKAEQIMYNAMLIKTSGASYLKYRTWTLTSAKNLTPGDCTAFNTVKAAWNAVSVPAQSADPTCTGGTTPPTTGPTTGPTTSPPTGGTQLLGNPGFESGTAPWTTTSGVISTASGSTTPHSGTHFAWIDGYGTTHTDTVSQSVTIPAGSHATLSFYLGINTAENTATAFDKLTVKAGSTTLATYSNLNAGAYTQKSFDVSALAGQTVTITFTGVEDSSAQTSFLIDDTALTTS